MNIKVIEVLENQKIQKKSSDTKPCATPEDVEIAKLRTEEILSLTMFKVPI